MFDTIRSLDLAQSFQLLLAFTTYAIVSNIRESSIEIFMARYLRRFDMFLCAIPTSQEMKIKLRLSSSPRPAQNQGKANKRAKKRRKLQNSPSNQGVSLGPDNENIQIPTNCLATLELAKSKSQLNEAMKTSEFRHFDYIMGMCLSLIIIFAINLSLDRYFNLHKKIYFTTFDAFFLVLLMECFRLLVGNLLPYFRTENRNRFADQRYIIRTLIIACVIGVNFLFAFMGGELDFKHHLLETSIGKPISYLVRTLFCALIAACYSIPGVRFGIAQKLLNENIPRSYVKTGTVNLLNWVQLIYFIVFALWFTQIRMLIQQGFGLTHDQYETWRLYFTIFSILLRFSLFPHYILLTMESTFRGHISELMRTKPMASYQNVREIIVNTNNSLVLAVCHFVVPFIIQFCFCLALFRRGRLYGNPFRADSLPEEFHPKATFDNFMADPELNRVVFGFFVWWGCLVHLIAGIVIQLVESDYLTNRFVEK